MIIPLQHSSLAVKMKMIRVELRKGVKCQKIQQANFYYKTMIVIYYFLNLCCIALPCSAISVFFLSLLHQKNSTTLSNTEYASLANLMSLCSLLLDNKGFITHKHCHNIPSCAIALDIRSEEFSCRIMRHKTRSNEDSIEVVKNQIEDEKGSLESMLKCFEGAGDLSDG